MRDFGVAVDASLPSGLEIGSGFALVTAVYRAKGWPMCSQINAFHDEEVLSKRIEGLIAEGKINWLWLAPPLRTFSPLHSSCIAGDLRPRGLPEGDLSSWRIARDNALWNRVLDLAKQVMEYGGHFILAHPQCSKAWQLRVTEVFLQSERVSVCKADMCAYEGGVDPPARRPTTLLSNFPWLHHSIRRCPGPIVHAHGVSGRVVAKTRCAGEYPLGFTEEVAAQHAAWPRIAAHS